MAKIRFKCACGKALAVEEKFAGRTARCPGCKRPVRVPDLPNAPAPDSIHMGGMAQEISSLSSAYGEAVLARARRERVEAILSERDRKARKRNLAIAGVAAGVLLLGLIGYQIFRSYGPSLEAAEAYPEAARPFLRGLNRRDPRLRAAATWEIADACGAEGAGLVGLMLDDREPSFVRIVAARALARIDPAAAAGQLPALFEDDDLDVRMTAAFLLAPEAAARRPLVTKALADDTSWLAWYDGLTDTTTPAEIAEDLAGRADRGDEEDRRTSAWLASATLDLDRMLSLLRRLLRSEEPAVRATVVHVLQRFLTREAFVRLGGSGDAGALRERIVLLHSVGQRMRHHENPRVKTASAEDPVVRTAAALAVARHGQDVAARVFIEPLTDDDWFVRFAAAKGLSLLSPAVASEIIGTTHVNEKNEWVRRVLRRIREQEAATRTGATDGGS